MITGKYPSLRLRRSRKYNWSRKLVQENNLSCSDLIYPIFLIEGKNKKQAIKSMPEVYRYSIDQLGMIINNVIKHKIPMVALFPSTPINKKDKFGAEALNKNNLVCKAISFIKKRFKNNIGIMSDVALDPYTTHGHDGLLKNGYVINDETVNALLEQALIQAQMGCDVIAPSDMMDGRVGKIRKYLDKNKYHDVQILSYAVKYASNFYGPFRDAVGSKKLLKNDKKNYQMENKKIEIIWDSVIEDVIGETKPKNVKSIKIKNLKTNKIEEIKVDGLFIAIGHDPATSLFKEQLKMDKEGYLITKPDSTETNIPGVYAAGDVKDKTFRQAVTAAGMGCMAALEAEKYISSK